MARGNITGEMATRAKAPTPAPSQVDDGRAHLTGIVSRIVDFPDAPWAEIAVDGAPELFRETRVPYPLQNEDGTAFRVKVGARVNIFVKSVL